MGFSSPEYWSGVATSSSKGSCWPRDWTHVSYVSHIGRRVLFTTRATWEVWQRVLGAFVLWYQRKTNTCVFSISNQVQVNLILEELPKESVCGLQGTQGDRSSELFPYSCPSTGSVGAGREGDGLAASCTVRGTRKVGQGVWRTLKRRHNVLGKPKEGPHWLLLIARQGQYFRRWSSWEAGTGLSKSRKFSDRNYGPRKNPKSKIPTQSKNSNWVVRTDRAVLSRPYAEGRTS